MSRLIFLFLTLSPLFFVGQTNYCQADRFGQTPVFDNSEIVVETDVLYGTATHFLSGTEVQLLADIYYPDPNIDPMETRPIVVLIHGGAFMVGSKEEMAFQCMEYARRGFVAATISYRLGWNCDGIDLFNICLFCPSEAENLKRATYNAIQDARAAFRFLNVNAASYGGDPNVIFTGGESAGAITALMATYADQAEADALIPGFSNTAGGLDESGNALPSNWTINGIISNCGALSDVSVMDNNELVPLVCFHDELDCIVPFNCGNVLGCFCATYFNACGSNQIHSYYASNSGPSQLNVVVGSLGHCSYPVDQVINHGACMMKQAMCGLPVFSTNHDVNAPAICNTLACADPVPNNCPEDLNGDGIVNTPDILLFLGAFGNACE